MSALVYNSDRYSILAFPAQEGFELVDKQSRRTVFIMGETARGLHRSIAGIPDEERTEEAVDEMLDDFCVGRSTPIVYH
jgi:hypothetical protein